VTDRAKPLDQTATYGGPGWSTRPAAHADDVAAGALWRRCGVCSEVDPLRQVVIAAPGPELDYPEEADYWLMLERPDLALLTRQLDGLAERYRAEGVTVHRARPAVDPPPNFLFQRDLFFATPEGVVLSRPASPRRAGEARAAAEVLAALGVPILMTPRGGALFEGADALWVSEREVLVGLGVRTNRAAFDQLAGLLADMGVTATALPVPPATQHLLGALDFVDRDLVVSREDRFTEPLADAMRARGIEALVVPAVAEVTRGGGANFVTLGPRRLLMPAGCPETRRRYEGAGIAVVEAPLSEPLKAAGGAGCLTGILERRPLSEAVL